MDLSGYLAGLPAEPHARGTAFEDILIKILPLHDPHK